MVGTKLINTILKLLDKVSGYAISYYKNSLIEKVVEFLNQFIFQTPLRKVSIFLLSALITKAIFIFLSAKPIRPLEYFFYLFIMFFTLFGLCFKGNLRDMMATSLFIKCFKD